MSSAASPDGTEQDAVLGRLAFLPGHEPEFSFSAGPENVLPCLASQLIPCSSLLPIASTLQSCQPHCLLTQQLESCNGQLCPRGPGYTQEGECAVQEAAVRAHGRREESHSITPGSCGPPGQSPFSCPRMHTCTPHHAALATMAKTERFWLAIPGH